MRDPGCWWGEIHSSEEFPAKVSHYQTRQVDEILHNNRSVTRWIQSKNIFPKGILSLCDEFVPGDPAEYFFDKNPENFAAILEMHRR